MPVVLAAAALEAAAAALFPRAQVVALAPGDLRPARPFEGALFTALAALPRGTCVGLVVPVRLSGGVPAAPPTAIRPVVLRGRPASRPSSGAPQPSVTAPARVVELVAVDDHVNLELRGPLTGPWPAGVPRVFPSMSGRYQPAVVRSAGGPRVYSGGVAAGVADLARLTPFERVALRRAGCVAASDQLVPPAVAAAFYTHTLAACGVVQEPPIDEE